MPQRLLSAAAAAVTAFTSAAFAQSPAPAPVDPNTFLNQDGQRLGAGVRRLDAPAVPRVPGVPAARPRHEDGRPGEGFDFNLELAQPGDRIDSATVPLPEGRKNVNLGLLKVTSVAEDGGAECLTITFNPMVLPKGVEPSADPMLGGRAR